MEQIRSKPIKGYSRKTLDADISKDAALNLPDINQY